MKRKENKLLKEKVRRLEFLCHEAHAMLDIVKDEYNGGFFERWKREYVHVTDPNFNILCNKKDIYCIYNIKFPSEAFESAKYKSKKTIAQEDGFPKCGKYWYQESLTNKKLVHIYQITLHDDGNFHIQAHPIYTSGESTEEDMSHTIRGIFNPEIFQYADK